MTKTTKVITKGDLNSSGCSSPNCGHDHSELFLHSSCHIGAGTYVKYVKATERLHISCSQCEKEIVIIQL
jgi:hypothetical protein